MEELELDMQTVNTFARFPPEISMKILDDFLADQELLIVDGNIRTIPVRSPGIHPGQIFHINLLQFQASMFVFDAFSHAHIQDTIRRHGVENLTQLLVKLNPTATIFLNNADQVARVVSENYPMHSYCIVEPFFQIHHMARMAINYQHITNDFERRYRNMDQLGGSKDIGRLLLREIPGLGQLLIVIDVPSDVERQYLKLPTLLEVSTTERYRPGKSKDALKDMIISGQYGQEFQRWTSMLRARGDILQDAKKLVKNDTTVKLVRWTES